MRKPILTALAVALMATAGTVPAAADFVEVVTYLETDYVPAVDFFHIQTRLEDPVTGAIIQRQNRTFFLGAQTLQTTYLTSVRTGPYKLVFDLLDRDGQRVASSAMNITVQTSTDGCQEPTQKVKCFTGDLPRPGGKVEMTGELLIDEDGDGELSPGDVARFHVRLDFDPIYEPAAFSDPLGPGLELIPGSVVATSGTVRAGNDPDDTSIRVEEIDAVTLVVFDAKVRPQISNQGELRFDGRVEPTDDPDTAALLDATVHPVQCSAGDCPGELAICEAELQTCSPELAACNLALDDCEAERLALLSHMGVLQSVLAAVAADDDGDGIPIVADFCPNTPSGEPVDDRGCSKPEFCDRIDPTQPSGGAICYAADWLGDEPLGEPYDCKPSGSLCLAQ